MSLKAHDLLFTLTINRSEYKEGVIPMVAKIFIIKETVDIKLQNLSEVLNYMGISYLRLFIIDDYKEVNINTIKEPCEINHIELNTDEFVKYLNDPEIDFLEYNMNYLYIIRNGSYIDVKYLIQKINNHDVTVGRGGSQKQHIVSPLELRFTSYLMAMFNFNYKHIASLNTFNNLNKDRYLLYINKKR